MGVGESREHVQGSFSNDCPLVDIDVGTDTVVTTRFFGVLTTLISSTTQS